MCSVWDGTIEYTGCLSGQLRLMTDVTKYGLQKGYTFPDKEPLLMRIAKEANLFGVRIKIV